MKYKNIDVWKHEMKKISESKALNIQAVQQRFALEELAKKISASKYADILILKGGFVVSTILGLDTRMTRDLDVTCRSTIYDIQDMKDIILDILNTEIESFFKYSLRDIETSQDQHHYSGFIISISAFREQTNIVLKIDVSNNTFIFPDALCMSLKSLFTGEDLMLMTYPIENIIAEKYETTLDRGEFNTRMRDLFDIYLLMKENKEIIDEMLLAETILNVSEDRGTQQNIIKTDEILIYLSTSKIFKENFERYRKDQYPFSNISLNDVFGQFKHINNLINEYLYLKGLYIFMN